MAVFFVAETLQYSVTVCTYFHPCKVQYHCTGTSILNTQALRLCQYKYSTVLRTYSTVCWVGSCKLIRDLNVWVLVQYTFALIQSRKNDGVPFSLTGEVLVYTLDCMVEDRNQQQISRLQLPFNKMAADVDIHIGFKYCGHSHVFNDRLINVSKPVRIGRSTFRAKPATDNLIFTCKVLSRNHAILWIEGGKVTSKSHFL